MPNTSRRDAPTIPILPLLLLFAGFYMIGSDGSVDFDPATMASLLQRPGLLADVNGAPDARNRTVAQWASTIQGLTWASGDVLRRAVGDGPLVTDDRPLPEYFLIRHLIDPKAPRLSLDGLRALLH